MDVDADTVAALLQWLLTDAPPVQRCYFLTTLGRLPPRPLGAALFDSLLAAGRPQCALRLVRHAGALSDERLAALARQHLVTEQEAYESAPTWRRQAWKRLAVSRPALALQLLGELWAKVQAAEKQPGVTATTMLRRAVLTLLHGTVGRQAAEALLVSRQRFNKDCLESGSHSWGGAWCRLNSLRPFDSRLLYEGGRKVAPGYGRWARRSAGSDCAPFQWRVTSWARCQWCRRRCAAGQVWMALVPGTLLCMLLLLLLSIRPSDLLPSPNSFCCPIADQTCHRPAGITHGASWSFWRRQLAAAALPPAAPMHQLAAPAAAVALTAALQPPRRRRGCCLFLCLGIASRSTSRRGAG
jgi:hypothetical protein